MQKLEKVNLKIEQQRAKIQKAEALAKALKIKSRQQNLMKIGELLEKANLDMADHKILLGAFLEISEKLSDEKLKSNWKIKGESLLNQTTNASKFVGIPLEVSFKTPPSPSLKALLKEKKLKWNNIREIWEGRGAIEEIQSIVAAENGMVKRI